MREKAIWIKAWTLSLISVSTHGYFCTYGTAGRTVVFVDRTQEAGGEAETVLGLQLSVTIGSLKYAKKSPIEDKDCYVSFIEGR